jgi:hypothetical protein
MTEERREVMMEGIEKKDKNYGGGLGRKERTLHYWMKVGGDSETEAPNQGRKEHDKITE